MCLHPLKDIDEVRVRIDAVKLAGDEQALHDPELSSATLSRAEHPVLAPDDDLSQRAF